MSETRVTVLVLLAVVGLAAVLMPWPETRAPGQGSAARELAPLTAAGPLLDLPSGAVVAVPLGATAPRSISIVLHPEDNARSWCTSWRSLHQPAPFVLCLQKRAQPSDTEEALRAALIELKQSFGAHVAKSNVVLAGFLEGADHAAVLGRQDPSFFSRLVLIDGGYSVWSASAAGAFKHRGGKRILFLATQPSFAELAQPKVTITRSLDIPTELSAVTGGDAPVEQRTAGVVQQKYAWLLSEVPLPQRVPNPRELRP